MTFDSQISNLKQKIEDKTALVAVVGLGYVGLPLAVAFAKAGFNVRGVDTNEDRVISINRGVSYIGDVSNKVLGTLVERGKLLAVVDQRILSKADCISVCVPTPLTKTKDPDLRYVIHEANEIGRRMTKDTLVVLESTTYPGTTREVVLPILERESGLKCGEDFYLAYSPERADPGNKLYGIRNIPKIVAGMDDQSVQLAECLYSHIAKQVKVVSSLEVAEMTKVFENVFRNVNIALVNELALLCERMELSVWDVIEATATKPFGYMTFYPGLGVGGHCIPLDPYYLSNKAREVDWHTRFIELATEINEGMPYHVADRIVSELGMRGVAIKDAKVMMLGVAYKPNIGDVRGSPSLKLMELLECRGADVFYNDPYVKKVEVNGVFRESCALYDVEEADCVVVCTAHSYYRWAQIMQISKLLFDCRGVTKGIEAENIVRLGE